jgi:lipopolysaccharide export system permease protein
MARFQRYVLIEVLKTFLFTAGLILSVLLLVGAVQQGVREGLPMAVVLKIVPYLIPDVLILTAPACMLFAVCSVFGRMSAAHEITALKAAGISPMSVIRPILAMSFLASVATFAIYDLSAGWARPGLKRTIFESVNRVICGVLRSNGSFRNAELSVVVDGVRKGELINPVIQLHQSLENERDIVLSARRATFTKPKSDGVMTLSLLGGELELGDEAVLTFPGRWSHDILLPCQLRDPNTASPAYLRLREIPHQIDREKRIVGELRERQRADPDSLPESTAELDWHRNRLFRLQAETSRRMANGFACLCFTVIGIPVAIFSRSSENVTVFFTCFGPVLVVFYPLLVTGETLARRGVFPELTVWMANASLLLIGVYLLTSQLRK